jgi:phosphoglycolate phosphatase-like HAD superfamily hydrolase
MKLVLFDIDGTLLASGGAGEKALRLAVEDRFGEKDGLSGIEIAGRTDSGIARQIFARHGLETTPEALHDFLEIYLGRLAEMLPRTQGTLLPGIVPLLEALRAREDVLLGLLTGNLERGAELKLTQYGVWHYFKFGAYADDHHDRNELGRFAAERALAKHGLAIPGEQTFVLGDTPHDIACGRVIGAKTVAVATGGYARAQLAEYQPDFLFDDFSDLASVLALFA